MYTLKFIRFREDGFTENCISCQSYEAVKHPCGDWSITTYPGMTMTDGVNRDVVQEHRPEGVMTYDCCWVENIHGETINKYTLPVK